MSSSHPQNGLSLASFSVWLGGELGKAVEARRASWSPAQGTQDLAWSTIVEQQLTDVSRFKALAAEIAEDGFAHLVILGMGGSTLCAEVFGLTFGKQASAPQLLVLDSTDPAQIRALRAVRNERSFVFQASRGQRLGRTTSSNISTNRPGIKAGKQRAGVRVSAGVSRGAGRGRLVLGAD